MAPDKPVLSWGKKVDRQGWRDLVCVFVWECNEGGGLVETHRLRWFLYRPVKGQNVYLNKKKNNWGAADFDKGGNAAS